MQGSASTKRTFILLLVFTGVLWRAYERAAETRTWTAVPCVVVSSKIDSRRPSPNSNIAHRVQVQYRYEFAGKARVGTRIKQVSDGFYLVFAEVQLLRYNRNVFP